MPVPIGDPIRDNFTIHSVNLIRYEESLKRRARKLLKELYAELLAELRKIDPTGVSAQSYKRKRLLALKKQTEEMLASTYKNFRGEITDELVNLSLLENQETRGIINTVLQVEYMTTGLTKSTARKIIKEQYVQGTLFGDWFQRLARNTAVRFTDQIAIGTLAGEPLDLLVRRVRGGRIPGTRNQFYGGILDVTTREAEALVRTAVATTANNVRMGTLAANQDITKGIQALVMLDGNTTLLCMSRSKMAWDFEGNPLPGTNTNIQYPGPPPWHFNCRTTLIPVLKSLAELGTRVKNKIPVSTQASMDGQVSEELDYEAWLESISETRQKKILGIGRWNLWKEGKIKTFRDLVDQTGRPLTIAELAA